MMQVSIQLHISIAEQTLKVVDAEGRVYDTFLISTSRSGTGQIKNSLQTPLGKHIIRAKIGAGCQTGSVFVGRRWTGEIWDMDLSRQYPQRDWILSRILWLSGLEIGYNRLLNCDTMQRFIYIHGTPDLEPIGIPRSHGCIRMRNGDVINLFDRVCVGTTVIIQN